MFATKFITRTVQSSVARRGFAEAAPAAAAGAQMILNFTTPHQPIYKKHPVSMVIIPSESGEYGVSAGHSPIISQLKPGVVTVIHQGVSPPPSPPFPALPPLLTAMHRVPQRNTSFPVALRSLALTQSL